MGRRVPGFGGVVVRRSSSPVQVFQSLLLFVLAGLAGIGGGYLVWLWLNDGRGLLLG
jgi:uncharacterized iron-regulated membrane protein